MEEQETAREGEKAGSVRWRGAEVAGVCGLLLVLLGVLALVAVDQPDRRRTGSCLQKIAKTRSQCTSCALSSGVWRRFCLSLLGALSA